MEAFFVKRQYPDEQAYAGGWWFSTTGTIVRYVITGVILVGFILLIGGGYLHARHRLKQQKEPLAYHRWLVSNNTRARFGMPPINPRGNYPTVYGGYNRNVPSEQWNMNNWNYPLPPPAYNPAPQQEHQEPPGYHHPPTASPYGAKGDAEASVYLAPMVQEAHNGPAPGPAYVPPPGPPPSHPPAYLTYR